jgi:hypothetical protein
MVVYGRPPLLVRTYTAGDARLPAVYQQMMDRDEFMQEIRDRLEQAQQYYKAYYDKRHREVTFEVGDWVWIRLLYRPVASLDVKGRGKLGPKFFGPYQILECVGEVSYKLRLPPGAKLNDVFHIGLLKKFCGEPPQTMITLPLIRHGRVCLEPSTVVKSRLARGRHELLVCWKGLASSESLWIHLEEFQNTYPSFQFEDELIVEGGRDVMWGKKYSRCRKQKQGTAYVTSPP